MTANANDTVDNIVRNLSERALRGRKRSLHHGYLTDLTSSLEGIACSAADAHAVLGTRNQANGVPPFACSFGKTQDTLHMLAIADEDGHVSIYDSFGASKLVKEWAAHNNAIFDLTWADTEPWVVTAAGDQTAALWDVSRGCRLAVFKQHSSSLKSATFRHSDRNVFATGARDGKIMVWDIRCNHKDGSPSFHTPVNIIGDTHVPTMPTTPKPAKRQRLTPSAAASKSSVTAVVFQDEYSLISAGATESTVKVWDIRTIYKGSSRKPIPKQEYQYYGASTRNIGFSSLVLNSSRSCVYASCTDDVIYAFNCLGVNTNPVTCYTGHSNTTFYIKSALSINDTFLLSGSSDSKAYIWKVSEPDKDPVQLTGHSAEVTSVTWSSLDFPKLVTCSDDNSFRVWRLHNLSQKKLDDSTDIVGRTVLEKSKLRINGQGVPSPQACVTPRPPSRGCVSLPDMPQQLVKPVVNKYSSIKTLFAKQRPTSPNSLKVCEASDKSKVLKLVPKDKEQGHKVDLSDEDVRDKQNALVEKTLSNRVAPKHKHNLHLEEKVPTISNCKDNKCIPQKLLESPRRLPLSPRKDNINSKPADKKLPNTASESKLYPHRVKQLLAISNSKEDKGCMHQKLLEIPCSLPLSPKKHGNIDSREAEKDLHNTELFYSSEKNTAQECFRDKRKANQGLVQEEIQTVGRKVNQRITRGNGSRNTKRMLLWPNSAEMTHGTLTNPCQDCKGNASLSVQRKPPAKITGYFKRLSRDKSLLEERGGPS